MHVLFLVLIISVFLSILRHILGDTFFAGQISTLIVIVILTILANKHE